MRRLGLLGLAIVFCCCTATRATASPIGIFSWSGDDLFGPLFTVENFPADFAASLGSPSASFADVFVDLTFSDGTAATSLALANIIAVDDTTIDPGEIAQNFTLPLSFAIESASLRLAFPLNGSMALLDATGAAIDALTFPNSSATIDFTPPTPVPEPSTFVLFAGTLIVARVVNRLRA